MPLGCHENKFAFWYFNATSGIQIHFDTRKKSLETRSEAECF